MQLGNIPQLNEVEIPSPVGLNSHFIRRTVFRSLILSSFILSARLFFFLGLIGFSADSAWAIELHLRNGDRLTGELVRREDGYIVFKSPFVGEIKVPEADAVLVEAPPTPVESLAGLPPAASAVAKGSKTGSSVGGGVKPNPTPWHGTFEFGFNQQTGRTDSLQTSVRAEAERKAGVDDYRFEGRVLYGEQYDQTTSDRYDGLFRYRHELSDRIFGQAQSSYTKDRIKSIEHDAEQNVGVGYKIIQRPRHEGNIGGGLTLQYRSAQGIEGGVGYLGEIFEDYHYKLTGRLTISQESNLSFSPESRDRYESTAQGYVATDGTATNYRLRFNSALQGKVTERLSLNLRFEYEFDNAILDPKAKVDQRITSSIGYGF